MEKLARISALLTVPIVGGAVVLVLLQLSSAAQQTSREMSVVLSHVSSTLSTTSQEIKQTSDAANVTLGIINRPCGGGRPCGTLANADKTVQHISDITVAAQRQVLNSGLLIAATTRNLDATTEHFDGTLDSFAGLALAGQTTLGAANQTIEAMQPVLGSANLTVQHFDELVTSTDVKQLVADVDVGVKKGDEILATTSQVEKKLTQCTLHPTFGCTFKSDAIFAAQLGGYFLH